MPPPPPPPPSDMLSPSRFHLLCVSFLLLVSGASITFDSHFPSLPFLLSPRSSLAPVHYLFPKTGFVVS